MSLQNVALYLAVLANDSSEKHTDTKVKEEIINADDPANAERIQKEIFG